MTNDDTHRKTIGYILWIFGFTGGLLGVGYLYDLWTLNDQVTLVNQR